MDQIPSSKPLGISPALNPFALPLGLASPMWFAYGAAASLSATWWWMSRMSRVTPPGAQAPEPSAVAEPSAMAASAAASALEAFAETSLAEPGAVQPDPIEPAPETERALEPVAETAISARAEPAPEPVSVAAEVVEDRPDELTLLRGVGPRVADALVARGVTSFAQLASWTEHEMAIFDRDLKLLGRSKRYDFLGQARDLAETAE